MKSKDYEEELKEWFRIEDTLRKAKKEKERIELANSLEPEKTEKRHRRQDASFERELEQQREDFFARKRKEREAKMKPRRDSVQNFHDKQEAMAERTQQAKENDQDNSPSKPKSQQEINREQALEAFKAMREDHSKDKDRDR